MMANTPLPGLVRVSLDASSVPAHPAGAGRYVLELATALGERPDVGLVVVCRGGDEDRWRLGPNVTPVGRAPRSRPVRLAWEQVGLPGLLARLPLDVHHAPHYTMP